MIVAVIPCCGQTTQQGVSYHWMFNAECAWWLTPVLHSLFMFGTGEAVGKLVWVTALLAPAVGVMTC